MIKKRTILCLLVATSLATQSYAKIISIADIKNALVEMKNKLAEKINLEDAKGFLKTIITKETYTNISRSSLF